MDINIKKLKDDYIIPTKGSKYSAGIDLYANHISEQDTRTKIAIKPGETLKIGTGIAIEIPNGYFGAVFARSGLATKYGVRPSNCVGVIDSDYRGEIVVALHNDSNQSVTISKGDRIAQMVLIPYLDCEFIQVNELSDTERGDGGFGSTGIK